MELVLIHTGLVEAYRPYEENDNPEEDASVAFPSASASDTVKEQANSFSVEGRSKSHAHKVKLSLILRSPRSSVSMGAPMSQCCGLIPCPTIRFPVTSSVQYLTVACNLLT